ncbi:hypothetical protein CXG81DRAFT_27128 [Caulochytrium protostelioides]|uniref:Pentacotripeptide-repeat region of PRORP domain-containing protein n=1 Tax=Caulochytrium protostelioides TaxID=1555241 RepID=A0A4P9X4Z7_9FUNG|nr:hypothetical protein CXG81DRAFT_27128 [Caulochytrium protostelioides]|eukprot:RKP00164.1 hypothetical protein CXG81DRAFT_27128 [Caulochytrium protostelioides]
MHASATAAAAAAAVARAASSASASATGAAAARPLTRGAPLASAASLATGAAATRHHPALASVSLTDLLKSTWRGPRSRPLPPPVGLAGGTPAPPAPPLLPPLTEAADWFQALPVVEDDASPAPRPTPTPAPPLNYIPDPTPADMRLAMAQEDARLAWLQYRTLHRSTNSHRFTTVFPHDHTTMLRLAAVHHNPLMAARTATRVLYHKKRQYAYFAERPSRLADLPLAAYRVTAQDYAHAITCYLRNHDLTRARHALFEMKTSAALPTPQTWSDVVVAYGQRGHLQRAEDVFKASAKVHPTLPMSLEMQTALLTTYGMNYLPDNVTALYIRGRKHFTTPALRHAFDAAYLEALSHAGADKAARPVFDQLMRQPLPPYTPPRQHTASLQRVRLYTAMLRAYVLAGNKAQAAALWQQLLAERQQGIDVAQRVEQAAQDLGHERAARLSDPAWRRDHGLPEVVVPIPPLFSSLCDLMLQLHRQAGDLVAMAEIWSQLESTPTIVTWEHTIMAHIDAGDWTTARMLMDRFLQTRLPVPDGWMDLFERNQHTPNRM